MKKYGGFFFSSLFVIITLTLLSCEDDSPKRPKPTGKKPQPGGGGLGRSDLGSRGGIGGSGYGGDRTVTDARLLIDNLIKELSTTKNKMDTYIKYWDDNSNKAWDNQFMRAVIKVVSLQCRYIQYFKDNEALLRSLLAAEYSRVSTKINEIYGVCTNSKNLVKSNGVLLDNSREGSALETLEKGPAVRDLETNLISINSGRFDSNMLRSKAAGLQVAVPFMAVAGNSQAIQLFCNPQPMPPQQLKTDRFLNPDYYAAYFFRNVLSDLITQSTSIKTSLTTTNVTAKKAEIDKIRSKFTALKTEISQQGRFEPNDKPGATVGGGTGRDRTPADGGTVAIQGINLAQEIILSGDFSFIVSMPKPTTTGASSGRTVQTVLQSPRGVTNTTTTNPQIFTLALDRNSKKHKYMATSFSPVETGLVAEVNRHMENQKATQSRITISKLNISDQKGTPLLDMTYDLGDEGTTQRIRTKMRLKGPTVSFNEAIYVSHLSIENHENNSGVDGVGEKKEMTIRVYPNRKHIEIWYLWQRQLRPAGKAAFYQEVDVQVDEAGSIMKVSYPFYKLGTNVKYSGDYQ